MFRNIVRDLRHRFDGLAVVEYYLERHIELDDESHGPMALSMLEEPCGMTISGGRGNQRRIALGKRVSLTASLTPATRLTSARTPSLFKFLETS
jgi:hypothetical protein